MPPRGRSWLFPGFRRACSNRSSLKPGSVIRHQRGSAHAWGLPIVTSGSFFGEFEPGCGRSRSAPPTLAPSPYNFRGNIVARPANQSSRRGLGSSIRSSKGWRRGGGDCGEGLVDQVGGATPALRDRKGPAARGRGDSCRGNGSAGAFSRRSESPSEVRSPGWRKINRRRGPSR